MSNIQDECIKYLKDPTNQGKSFLTNNSTDIYFKIDDYDVRYYKGKNPLNKILEINTYPVKPETLGLSLFQVKFFIN